MVVGVSDSLIPNPFSSILSGWASSFLFYVNLPSSEHRRRALRLSSEKCSRPNVIVFPGGEEDSGLTSTPPAIGHARGPTIYRLRKSDDIQAERAKAAVFLIDARPAFYFPRIGPRAGSVGFVVLIRGELPGARNL